MLVDANMSFFDTSWAKYKFDWWVQYKETRFYVACFVKSQSLHIW